MSSPADTASWLFADRRPVTTLADLFAKVWQLAYVTNDLERGLELMRERHGFEHVVDAPLDGATFYFRDQAARTAA